MLSGLPACYAPESAEILGKRWIILSSGPNPNAETYLPHVYKIPAWPSNAGIEEQHLEFTIESIVAQGFPWNEKRFLYRAKMQNDDVMVKFTRRYCTDLHQICAKRGHAPKLLGYGTVPGGWHVVVMEFVDHDINGRLAHYARVHLDRWEKDLTSLVEEFHGEGLVHGDLRDVNLIVPRGEPERIILVDYDWGGKHGDVSFPSRHLHEDLTMMRELESLEITKEHDRRVLRNTIGKLRLPLLIGGEADEVDVS
jgi:tRNA A-37 threonylcarbamoyl transferase component Bud32